MTRCRDLANCLRALFVLAAFLCWTAPTWGAPPAGEQRDFTILVDGKPAGEYRMAISHFPDGTTEMIGQADVSVSKFFIRYTYTLRETEIWKDGRLQRLRGVCNDDGKRFTVSAVAEGDLLRVTVNGEARTVRPDVWTTSYWQLPDRKYFNKAVTLLDADTGKPMKATLQYVGPDTLNIGGQGMTSYHFRLVGDVKVDVWYDARGRLVKEDALDDGHRMVLQLARIQESKP